MTVSYTHLDVYKRQILYYSLTRLMLMSILFYTILLQERIMNVLQRLEISSGLVF